MKAFDHALRFAHKHRTHVWECVDYYIFQETFDELKQTSKEDIDNVVLFSIEDNKDVKLKLWKLAQISKKEI